MERRKEKDQAGLQTSVGVVLFIDRIQKEPFLIVTKCAFKLCTVLGRGEGTGLSTSYKVSILSYTVKWICSFYIAVTGNEVQED